MSTDNEKMGYWSVVAIGVGGMVGGGIFAVLGLSVQLTRGAAPVAFLIAGLVALVTSYSYFWPTKDSIMRHRRNWADRRAVSGGRESGGFDPARRGSLLPGHSFTDCRFWETRSRWATTRG